MNAPVPVSRQALRAALWLTLCGALWASAPSGSSAQRLTPPQPPTPSSNAIATALASYGHEPSVHRVVAWALGLSATAPERADEALRRGRRSGLLPSLRFGVRRGLGVDASSQLAGDTTRLSTATDLSLEATLTFRLDHLAYGPDEVAWARERRSLELARAELTRTVVELYFRRRRLQLERDLLGVRTVERLVMIQQLSALLDELTGGAFSEHVRRR
ncbi:MAG: hypothetical protein GXP55_21095 [Deltaproteobacteria bacterium]|nr:hypothetical protein [Deltaproteobacteria bacterium]